MYVFHNTFFLEPKITMQIKNRLFVQERDRDLINRTGVIIGWGDSSRNGLRNMIKSFTLQQGEI